jgi:hypothetical protein
MAVMIDVKARPLAVSMPDQQTTATLTPVTFDVSAIVVSDPNEIAGQVETLNLAVANGILSSSDPSDAAGDGTSTLSMVGTVSQINSVLQSLTLTYTPNSLLKYSNSGGVLALGTHGKTEASIPSFGYRN